MNMAAPSVRSVGANVRGIATWHAARWLLVGISTVVTATIIGVPTGIVPTPFYTRMTPVLWWNYPIWAVTSLLVGLIAATYLRSPLAGRSAVQGRTGAGGLLSAFAVGCPICNKLVVAALGVSGALHVWAPLQPFLGVGSVALLTAALHIRLAGERRCRMSHTPASSDA